MSKRVGSVGSIPLWCNFVFVIHLSPMDTETTAMPPPPSKDTSSIDSDMSQSTFRELQHDY